MNGIRGKPPSFEPTSQFLNKPDRRLYKKNEQLHFPKPLKEPSYIPLKPITPIFKVKPEEDVLDQIHKESTVGHSSVTEDEEDEDETEYEEDDFESEGFGECEYEEEEDDDEPQLSSTSAIEPLGEEQPLPNFGTPPSLVEMCLRAYAMDFSTLWKYAKYIPAKNLKTLSLMIDLDSTDVGMAARALPDHPGFVAKDRRFHDEGEEFRRTIYLDTPSKFLDDDAFWKRWTKHKWTGYHKPWSHGKSWKTYFLEKYLAECLAGQDPDRCKLKDICRLARRVKQWIYTLDIKQLSSPPWPAAVDVASSTDTEEDSDLDGILSDITLSEFLNRNINFFPMPESTTRLPLLPVFQRLTNLTHLTFSFGYDNFYMHKEMKFSKITDEDAVNLAQALAACTNLYCFKLTRSKVTPEQLESIIFGLEELQFFREAEFSHLFLNNNHMISVTGLLLLKHNLRVLCLKNNDIGSEGFIRLLHVIILKDCKLRILDVSMNPIGDPGGVAVAALLAKKNRFLKRLFMSGTGLTYISGYNFGIVLYFNKCLEVLDLSVNQFSDFAAEALMKGLEHNYTLKRIDLRECGIPFSTVREMERTCFKNAETERRQKYVYPVVHPKDFSSGFNELDSELPEELKPERSDEELVEDEEENNTTRELMQIFVWATAQMKPRNKFLLVRDIHAMMKKTKFVTGFDAVVDKLILARQKELILKSRIDAKREREERAEGSALMIDFSYQEFMKKTGEKLKLDFIELEALQVLKDVNRCGRIDELFKAVQSDRIDGILRRIGRHLDNDIEMLSPTGITLPFAKKWYKGFPDPEPDEEVSEDETGEEMMDEGEGEEEECDGGGAQNKSESKSAQDFSQPLQSKVQSSRRQSDSAAVDVAKPKSQSYGNIGRSTSLAILPSRKEKTPSNPFVNSQVIDFGKARSQALSLVNISYLMPTKSKSRAFFSFDFQDIQSFQDARDKVLGIRAKFRKWPKDGPPKFPKVIPYEIIKDCNEDLPETDSEKEDDFPYWLDQWFQKY